MNLLKPLLFACLALHAFPAHAEIVNLCPTVFEKAELEKEAIPSDQSVRKVVGEGRLYFHTAPDKQCQLRNVFVVRNDRLEAYAASRSILLASDCANVYELLAFIF